MVNSKKAIATSVAAVAAAGLVAAPLAGTLPLAFADDGTAGTVTITKDANNSDVTYKTYKLFDADVAAGNAVEDGLKHTVTNVAFATGAETVIGQAAADAGLSTEWTAVDGNPQKAAEFVAAHITASKTDAPDAKTFGGYLAARAVAGLTATGTTVTPGTPATLADGYYLFVGDGSENGDLKGAASGPLFAAVGGDAVTIQEKMSVPTVIKQVKDDKEGSTFGEVADATIGQEVEYKLEATLPTTLADYKTYKLVFTDVLSSGLDFVAGSAKVTVANATETAITPTVAGNTLTFTIDDVLTADPTAAANGKVTITYKAKLNANAAIAAPNDNTVTLQYSNNPNSDSLGTTETDDADLYTFELDFQKKDNGTNAALGAGFKFTIQDEHGNYIKKDGDNAVIQNMTAEPTAYEWVTDANGQFSVIGIDAGTYTIKETAAPTDSGYNVTANNVFTVVVAPTYAADGESITAMQSTDLIDGTDAAHASAIAAADKTIDAEYKNVKGLNLPITGEQGFMLLAIAGGIVVVVSLGSMIVRKRNQKDGFEE